MNQTNYTFGVPPPYREESNLNAPRSLDKVILSTFALRMAVITAYGHLGSLENLCGSSNTALPRMLISILSPIGTLAESIYNYAIAAGLHIPYAGQPTHGSPETVRVEISGVPPDNIKHTTAPRTWDSFLMIAAHFSTFLVVLAQAAACLLLVVRRRQIENASLLLDSINGVYALVGICSACNSLLITAIGREWECLGRPKDNPLRLIYANYWQQMIMFSLSTAIWRGKSLSNGSERLHMSARWKPPLLFSSSVAPFVSLIVLYGSEIFCIALPVLQFYRKFKAENWDTNDVVQLAGRCIAIHLIVLLVGQHLVYAMTSVWELVVIAQGDEIAV